MSEQTIIKVMDIPAEPGFVWHPDINLAVLSSRLDEAGREVALSKLQDHWRRTCIRVVA